MKNVTLPNKVDVDSDHVKVRCKIKSNLIS